MIRNLFATLFALLPVVTRAESAPDFRLPATDGSEVALSDLKGKTVVLEWFNPNCPFVKKHYSVGAMQALQKEYADKGVVWLMINSAHAAHRDHQNRSVGADYLVENKITGARLLIDATGGVGKAYGAKTTPHMFVINPEGAIVYRGAIDDDDSSSGNPAEAKNYVRAALDELLAGKTISLGETSPYGCSVKYAS